GFTREMFYDQTPEDEEEEEEEEIPGLYRYLTLWSQGKINLNTADRPVVRALFDSRDDDLAERLLEWRDQEAEEQPEDADPDDEPAKNALESIDDLKKIDGFDQAALTRNRLTADTVAFSGSRFSIHLLAESTDGLRRQERYVIDRNPVGFRTLLAEERNDPLPREDEEEDEEE
ncbi:MAG: type II secretion system protein GspK, partial [Planctomycetota bacterium]